MQISEIKVEDIRPNNFNPNKMPGMTFKKMLASIKKFGLFNPIIVRKALVRNSDSSEECYEIVDGEWRWRSYKELKLPTIPARVIEATDEEVKQMIFATKITGRHNAYDAQEVLKDFVSKDTETMSACNLDKLKLERKTKYMNFEKGRRLKKDSRDMKDEALGLPTNEEYKCIFAVTLDKKDYESVTSYLKTINKNLGVALIETIGRIKGLDK